MAKRKKVDWAACEEEYRAGVLSTRALAAKFGCSESAIRDRAKRYGWSKDLTKAVKDATRARLLRTDLRDPNAREDAQIVEQAVDLRVAVVTTHRKDLQQLHGLKRVLMDRLAIVLQGATPEGPCLGDKESPGDLLEKLSRITARLIPLERQAHNLDEDPEPPGGAGGEFMVRFVRAKPQVDRGDTGGV